MPNDEERYLCGDDPLAKAISAIQLMFRMQIRQWRLGELFAFATDQEVWRVMMKLSEHFDLHEFDHDGTIPAECFDVFEMLAEEVLEPVRAWLNRPMTITSGYRPPQINQQIHGAPHSEHVATKSWCAADFTFDADVVPPVSLRACFDWIRSNPTLPFHQVILEHSNGGNSIIHVSINTAKIGERQALEGATYNQSAYSSFDVVPFEPLLTEENA
jgi:hypothetical protein